MDKAPTTEFAAKQRIVYPSQGVGQITDIVEKSFKNGTVLYYIIYLEFSDMTVMVPVDKAAELGIRAKGVLMAREAGFEAAPDPTLPSKFEELRYLEKSIGTTGMRALQPFIYTSTRDLWQLNMLDEATG